MRNKNLTLIALGGAVLAWLVTRKKNVSYSAATIKPVTEMPSEGETPTVMPEPPVSSPPKPELPGPSQGETPVATGTDPFPTGAVAKLAQVISYDNQGKQVPVFQFVKQGDGRWVPVTFDIAKAVTTAGASFKILYGNTGYRTIGLLARNHQVLFVFSGSGAVLWSVTDPRDMAHPLQMYV